MAVATPAVATGGVSNAPDPLPKIVTVFWAYVACGIPAQIAATAIMLIHILLKGFSSRAVRTAV